MAITTDGKIDEMLRLGKADNTVQLEYLSVTSRHTTAKANKNMGKMAIKISKEILKDKKERYKAIKLYLCYIL